jgi:riboflavin synthase
LFTGIIEHIGTIKSLDLKPSRGRITIQAPGLVSALAESTDLSGETIQKTSFDPKSSALKNGSRVNLEQPLTADKEFGGHFVQGHVDGTGRVTHLDPEGPECNSWWFGIEIPEDFARYIVPKGSITIDGISLTVARWNSKTRIAEIAVIPYTYEHTNLSDRRPGDAVNLEGDVLGKYVERYLEARHERTAAPISKLSLERLIADGF